jgi:hypothetical protein
MPDVSDTPFRPGTVWLAERGKLYRFTDDEALVVRPWPTPQAWRKRAGQGWAPASPMIDLSMADAGTNYGERMAWAQVPKEVRDAVCIAHFSGFQWSTLSMIARCPGALELAQKEPMIAAMLAVGNRVRPVPVSWLLRSIRGVLKVPDGWGRWRRVHGWLGLDESRSFVRLTRKAHIEKHRWRLVHWRLIVALWETPRGRKLLQHLPEVTPDHAEVVASLWRLGNANAVAAMLHPNFMNEILEQGIHGGAWHIAHDLAEVWPLVWPERPVPQIRSIEHLEILRAEVNIVYEFEHREEVGVEQIRRQSVLDALNGGASPESLFPPPPLPGTGIIQPLLTPKALVREGEMMGHCLRNEHWTTMACMALGFAYHVELHQERATFWVARDRESPLGLHVEQIQGPHNQTPSAGIVSEVRRWFRHHEAWAHYRNGGAVRPTGEESLPIAELWAQALPGPDRSQVGQPFLGDEIPF